MNLTSAARGLTAGLTSPSNARGEALEQAHGGRAFQRGARDDSAQQVEKAAGEGRNGQAAAAIGLAWRPAP